MVERRPSERLRLSRPDLAAQFVADIVKQRVEDARERKREVVRDRERHQRRPWLLVLIPLFFVLFGWNMLAAGSTPAVFSRAEREASLRFRIYLAAQGVKAFRDSAGYLPPDLPTIGIFEDRIAYVPDGTLYAIVGSEGGLQLTYRSGEDLQPYAAAYQRLARPIATRPGVR